MSKTRLAGTVCFLLYYSSLLSVGIYYKISKTCGNTGYIPLVIVQYSTSVIILLIVGNLAGLYSREAAHPFTFLSKVAQQRHRTNIITCLHIFVLVPWISVQIGSYSNQACLDFYIITTIFFAIAVVTAVAEVILHMHRLAKSDNRINQSHACEQGASCV